METDSLNVRKSNEKEIDRQIYKKTKTGITLVSSQAMLNPLEQKFEIKKLACDFYQAQSDKQQIMIDNTKSYLNMVIHDFRNPTNQFEYQVKETIKDLKVLET